ncbi:alpha/beta hydrolase [Smaragdicoccus niigatensis]|uniref:alpha/beta hydrolase n=1 Tax=Smaragdicoccus niigatensis TaxID=359359 RepID=UPI000364C0F6|nr:alpha/beta hydrolase [Smaragdicoccus niigatensis]
MNSNSSPARLSRELSRIRTALSVLATTPPRPGTAQLGSVILSEHKLTLTRYGNGDRAVLLIPPPAAPAAAFDLRRGQSLLEQLITDGHTVYLADYGDISFADRKMGFEDWIDRIVPNAAKAAAADAGENVAVIGWSLGGTLSLLTSAAHPDLPIRSIAAIATPIDYSKLATIAPLRQASALTGGQVLGTMNRVIGGIPPWLVRNGYRLTSIERELKKPWFVLQNTDDVEKLDQMKSIDGFTAAMPAYPGRLFNQMWHRLMLGNELASGGFGLRDRTVRLDAITVPVLAVAGLADAIAPVPVARPITDVLSRAASVRFETAPGGHLGVLTGPKAAATTWRYLDEHLASSAH